jgi:Spy/CpxP family protein refolding chaperone
MSATRSILGRVTTIGNSLFTEIKVMNIKSMLVGIAALAIVGSTAMAQPAPGGPGGAAGGRGGRGGMMAPVNPYDQMVEQLNLTDDQKPKIKVQTDAMQKAITDFQTQSREKMTAATDQASRQAAMDEVTQLRTTTEASLAKIQTDINAILTPEQQTTWEGFKANQAITNRLNMLQLTDDQKAKIKELATAAGKEIADAKTPDDALAAKGKLVKKILTDVLTDAQMARLVGLQTTLLPAFGGGFGGPGGPGGAGGAGGAGGGRGGRRGGGGGGNAPAPAN